MKKIFFDSVEIKNFLSVGKNKLKLNFNSGISLITGENKDNNGKNGVGKSTITDAIYWCLFGNTIRELKKDKIIHNKSKNDCEVVLTFKIEHKNETKNYVLKRTLEPSKVSLVCDEEDITPSTIPLTDELIKTLIGGNEEVFQNSVIMSANNTLPFMAQKKVDKRKFIEGILQLNIFSEMLLKIRSEYNDYKKENDLLSNDFVNQQKNLELFEQQKVNFEEIKNNKIKSINDKIEINKNEIEKNKLSISESTDELKQKIKDLNEKNKIISDAFKKIQIESNQIISNKAEISSEINQSKKEKQKFIEKGNSCPVCNREYCKDDIDTIQTKINELDVLIEEKTKQFNILLDKEKQLKEKASGIETGLEKIKNKNLLYTNQIQKNILTEQKIENLIEKNKEYNDDVLKIKNEKYDYDKNIVECNKKIENLNEKLLGTKKHLQVLDSCKFIVSEDGVKTFIINKILKILNERLNFYLKTFDAPCKCEFNDVFEEIIYNDQGKECSYFNFSGGERKRIDVAILFTFQDVLRLHSGISYSLNIYDELFDSALDDLGVDKILNILKLKVEKYQESVYIISHKTSTKSNIDNVILLEKENGETKLVNS
jgi:DNA repair exonuclease SbcCD ATPase subunit